MKKGLFGARFSLLSPDFFSLKKTSQLLPVFFPHLAAAPLPLQCMCCPQNLLHCMCCPEKNPMHVLPGFFPFLSKKISPPKRPSLPFASIPPCKPRSSSVKTPPASHGPALLSLPQLFTIPTNDMAPVSCSATCFIQLA